MNKNDINSFLYLLTGENNPAVTWQVFYDPKDGQNRPDLAATCYQTLDAMWDFLVNRQEHKCGVYACINGTDGLGREIENINSLRVLFADYDGTTEPDWPVQPTFKCKRDDTHGHAYWALNPDEWTNDDWSEMQRRIALCCGTDKQVIDVARVARVPEFLHLKNPSNPAVYRLVSPADGVRKVYSKQELIEAFKLSQVDEEALTRWSQARKGIDTGVGYTDNPAMIDQCKRWLAEQAPVAIEGNGTHTLIQVMSFCHDRGVSKGIALPMAWELYNPRCQPPWGDKERRHFDGVVDRAYRYATNEAGCRATPALFKSLGELPAPVDGWEANAAVNNEPMIKVTSKPMYDRITHNEAITLQAQLTVKSGHYDLARAFDGAVFDGCKLIRDDKMFYRYTGTHWEEVPDSVIKSLIQRYYSDYKPSDTFTRGVFNCISDLVNFERFRNNSWMNEEITDPNNTVVFKNCLLDVSGSNAVMLPHNHEYICLNSLPHDYDPKAACPTWLRFLDDIWANEPELKLMLQEWFGYMLSGTNDMQKMAVLHGVSRGGKSLITEVAEAMVGQYSTSSTDLNVITNDSTMHDMHQSLLTILPDQEDVEHNMKRRVLSTLKGITGGDLMGWHVIYKGRQTGTINSKLMMTTNSIPTFPDSSGALVNRMLIFPFTKSFRDREDFTLPARIKSEIAGITNWALEGRMRLMKRGRFTEATASIEEKEDLRQSMFVLAGFLSDYCELGDTKDHYVSCNQAYNAYKVWATANGVKSPLERRKFVAELKNSPNGITHGRRRIDGERDYFLTGVRLVGGKFNFNNVTSIAT